jgi:hypothetical protein
MDGGYSEGDYHRQVKFRIDRAQVESRTKSGGRQMSQERKVGVGVGRTGGRVMVESCMLCVCMPPNGKFRFKVWIWSNFVCAWRV